MARSESEIRRVRLMVDEGLSDYEVSRRTGVPRATIRRWRVEQRTPEPLAGSNWVAPDPAAYCYLLGLYLGDGNILYQPPNGWTLRLACDQAYPNIINEAMAAMARTFPPRKPTRRAASSGASDVLGVSHPGIGKAFPQHGPGRKHLRTIELVDWQRELTHRHAAELVRGLIHSDGCRTENRFKTKLPSGRIAEYRYIRYFFSNHSEHIRAIFVEHCELLGVRVTQSNPRNLSISHRASVAILESLVGPKT